MPIPQGLLQSLLSKTPFLSGVDEQRRITQQGEMQQLQQTSALMQLMQQAQAQQQRQQAVQRDEALRTGMQGKSMEEAIPWLIQQGPEGVKMAAALAEATKDLRKPKQTIVGPGSTVLGEDNKPIYTAPFKPEKDEASPEIVKLLRLIESTPPGPMRDALKRRVDVMNKDPSTVINNHNPAPVTLQVIKDSTSETGWSSIDARTGKKVATGVPAPSNSSEAAGFARQKLTAREMAERDMNYPTATRQVKIALENLDTLSSQLSTLRDHKGLPGITGAVYGRTPSVTKDSMAAQAIYENVVNNVFVNALQSMREASKTGGAVGNVSDREGDRLQQTLAALSRAQGTEDFKGQAKLAMHRLAVAKKNIQDAYNETYSYKQQGWKVER
jgi:hypothetical protein